MEWEKQIKLNTPYDFDYALSRLAFDTLNQVDLLNKQVTIPIRFENNKTTVTVQSIGTIHQPLFKVKGKDRDKQLDIQKQVNGIFAWDQDLATVKSFFASSSIDKLFKKFPYTPIVREFDLFGSLMKTIIHQQLNMSFAQTLTSRFVEKYGEKYQGVWFYPTAEQVASIPYEDLQKMQFSRRKAEYVVDTAKLVADGSINFISLSSQTNDEIIAQLTKVRGIGAWTVQNWLMFGLGRKDLFPVSDIGILNALRYDKGFEHKPSKDTVYEWSKEWSPYRSYAAMTLWRSIEDQ
ncbi:DNA-3-methyladenine glycosylase [Gracilibacillus sp. YIM 98692]|uniref:DNA-3-methyladenine glycosylase family protein n=1 Tax=Gracilibacillus sp. YIM 98692 TaxID=2663532 RepID=UPI0013D06BEA|nr:DNA-3-methyladenine glycosylase [Gracilibacillus sp. YIM 98692]